MPIDMAIKNIKTLPSTWVSADIAGPGQNPTRAHPTPNIDEPIISGLSIFFFNCWLKPSSLLNNGADIFLPINMNAGILTIIAPPITNISEGSQFQKTFKKPMTLAGFVIPAITSPMPNMMPLDKGTIIFFIITTPPIQVIL